MSICPRAYDTNSGFRLTRLLWFSPISELHAASHDRRVELALPTEPQDSRYVALTVTIRVNPEFT
jgi:hypothetical protein